jgi:hypothetical protein
MVPLDLDIPQDLKELYKTVWGMSNIIDITPTWLFCGSISIVELVYAKCQLINAFFMLGNLVENGNVLLENKSCGRCDQVYLE